jgi:hypothetical protein
MAEPDVIDDFLDFGDLFFAEGKAFSKGTEPPRDENTPATINLLERRERTSVAKRWFEAEDGRTFLIESVRLTDLAKDLAVLPKKAAGRPAKAYASKGEAAKGLETSRVTRSGGQMQLAKSNDNTRPGVVLYYLDRLPV